MLHKPIVLCYACSSKKQNKLCFCRRLCGWLLKWLPFFLIHRQKCLSLFVGGYLRLISEKIPIGSREQQTRRVNAKVNGCFMSLFKSQEAIDWSEHLMFHRRALYRMSWPFANCSLRGQIIIIFSLPVSFLFLWERGTAQSWNRRREDRVTWDGGIGSSVYGERCSKNKFKIGVKGMYVC